MGVFNNFPYANFHELNADWIIEQVRKVMDEWEEYKTDMDLWKLGVDDQLATFQAWFDNLDVQDEVRTVMNELILSGEFIEITSPQIVSATEAWLASHITPTTPAVDDTLSISGAAADAKVTGDRISDLKEDSNFIHDSINTSFYPIVIKNGTPPNAGNTYAVCSNDLIPCEQGNKISIYTNRPNTPGYHYVYGNYYYNSSEAIIKSVGYPNGKSKVIIEETPMTYFNLAITEQSDSDPNVYNALRTTDFDGYYIMLESDYDNNIKGIEKVADTINPILTNGSVGNPANDTCVSTFKVVKIGTQTALKIEYIGEFNATDHLMFSVDFYTNAVNGMRASTAFAGDNRLTSLNYQIPQGQNYLYLENELLKYPTAEYISVTVFRIDNNGNAITLRFEDVGNVLKVSRIQNEYHFTRNDIFAYIGHGGNFNFRDIPYYSGYATCAWRTTDVIIIVIPPIGSYSTTMADLISSLPAEDISTDSEGVDWVTLRAGRALVFDFSDKAFKSVACNTVNQLTRTQYPLLISWSFQMTGGLLYTKFMNDFNATPMTTFNSNNIRFPIELETKANEYSALISSNSESEKFLFFTDPHTYGANYRPYWAEYLQTVIQKYYNSTPTDFVLCGGDWLGDSDTPTQAKYKLGLIRASMESMVTPYYPVNGNHDTNYQGTTELSIGEQVNVTFSRFGKAYYKFSGSNTEFYILDSQLDNALSMDSYKWEQIDWLATNLLTETHEHIAIAVHIWVHSGNIIDFATNISSVISAYNGKTTVTLNGQTYDFSNVTGHIEFVLAGHTHVDGNYKVGTMPVIVTKNTWSYSWTPRTTVAFELVFADYTARTIDFVRVGDGGNRKFSLTTGEPIT